MLEILSTDIIFDREYIGNNKLIETKIDLPNFIKIDNQKELQIKANELRKQSKNYYSFCVQVETLDTYVEYVIIMKRNICQLLI